MTSLYCKSEDDIECVFTPFSIIHLLSGAYLVIIFKYIGYSDINSFLLMNIVHGLYELKDFYIMYHTDMGKKGTVFHNTFINSLGDQLSAIVGAVVILYVYNNKQITRDIFIKSTIYITIISIFAWMNAFGALKIG
uniref:DUF2585 family protein n=1 Tax=viral metagenome TaxID=1070528 RepID=A0A6C0LXE2_9ZZZZ